ncbi:MAG: glycosyltransferase [Leifsonia flava]
MAASTRVAQRLHARQKAILIATYWILWPVYAWRRRPISWVVGAEEIALMVRHIASALPDSYSVIHRTHKYYTAGYDCVIEASSGVIGKYRRLYGGAVLLGWLMHRAHGVIYVGQAGLLESGLDRRAFEFSFLKKHGLGVVCYFTGNDIRSPRLMHDLERTTGRKNLASHLEELNPVFGTDEYEQAKRDIAAAADAYADVIFNARLDQLSYLTSDTEPFMYFFPDDRFVWNEEKFDEPRQIIVVHAPSKPLLKGTEHVRAAVDRLRADGLEFDYRELTDVTNDEVIATLGDAHIVLNQFYAFIPGVFGIEAMASGCAMLASADARVETDLGGDANDAWVVTAPDEIYSHLRNLLEHPELIREQARRGFDWARLHASASEDAKRMRKILERVTLPS